MLKSNKNVKSFRICEFCTAFTLGIVTPWGGAVAPLQEWRGRTGCARGALQYSPTRPFGRLRELGPGNAQFKKAEKNLEKSTVVDFSLIGEKNAKVSDLYNSRHKGDAGCRLGGNIWIYNQAI